jgi:ubiquinol-cytochrome c reductase cytochrome c subunit
MPRLRTVALVLLAGGVLLAVVPSVIAVPQPSTSRRDAPAQDERAGRDVYVARCASCHGPDGGGTDRGPSLVGVGAAAADFELRTGRMPFTGAPGTQAVRKPPAFDEQTIRNLVDYVASLGPGPAVPVPKIDPTTVSAGQRLFIANCAPCHGATANGGAVGGGALAPPLDKATPVEVAEAMLIGPGQMPVFSSFSDDERNSVVSYVKYLQESVHPGGFSIGGVGPVPEGFVGWVLGLGLLLVIVVLLTREWQGRRV